MRGEVRRWSYGEAAVLFCGGMAIVARTGWEIPRCGSE
jgi:hypothetical protein